MENSMKLLKTAFGLIVLLVMAPRSFGAIIEVDLVAPLSAAQFNVQASDDQQLQLSVIGSNYVVSAGDTVRVKWTFSNGETFQLLPDPHIGLQGWLILPNPLNPPYTFQFGVSWSFLDANGVPILTGSEPTQGHSGAELPSGGLTVANQTAFDVGGLVMELTDIQNLGIGELLPLEFSGARFLVHNALFGSPFNTPASPQPVPVPSSATLSLLMAGLIGFLSLLYLGHPPTIRSKGRTASGAPLS